MMQTHDLARYDLARYDLARYDPVWRAAEPYMRARKNDER
jgi:hypothetical protein